MSRTLASLAATLTLLTAPALAEAPKVAADIAPVHALVARVMDGVGTPALIVAPGASPHEYSLRPSEAGALQDADLVFWVGPGLTPWLADATDTLAGDARVIALLEAEGTQALPMREGALFEAHDHGGHDGHDDHDDHAGHEDHEDHEDHAEHGHEAHDDHSGEHDHGHDHGAHDPHAWLSPDNATAWMAVIADALAKADPDNADTYRANAAAARDEMGALRSEIEATLAPVRDRRFIVFHDAYQYFERAFDLPAAGAIALSDASEPSPARIAEIRARVAELGVSCVLSEPQFSAGIVAAVTEGTETRTAVLDPLGSALTPGADLYPALLRGMADALADCL